MSNKNMTGSVLQDLYLEFFAVFIPGFILVAGIITLISMCHYCIFEKVSFCSDWFSKINFTHSFFFLVVISYAFGAILHRKKPEHPDKESAFHEWCCKKKKNPRNNLHCLYGSFVFIVIFYSLLKAQQGIIKSLHYLRVKEIVTILIQANILRNEYPNKAIWIDIAEKENRFKQSLREMTPIPCKNCVYEDVCAFSNLDRQVQATEISSSQAVTTNTNRCNSCGRVHIEITDNSTNINN